MTPNTPLTPNDVHPGQVLLSCQLTHGAHTLTASQTISADLWDAADEPARRALRDEVRHLLAKQIVSEITLPVSVARHREQLTP